MYQDLNDKGKTGWGIMTNEPEFPWHVRAVQHYEWKQTLARSATVIPGGYYPDDRFLRIHQSKSAMPAPTSEQEAVLQAVHVLNTVTVPMGDQRATDSGAGEGEGDHTLWGAIYAHGQSPVLYYRTLSNHNLLRVPLAALPLAEGDAPKRLPLSSPALPWFVDVASHFAA